MIKEIMISHFISPGQISYYDTFWLGKNYPRALPDSPSLPQKEVEKKLHRHFHRFWKNIL